MSVHRAGRVFLIGAGPGDPKLVTLRACEVLREADVIFVDALVSPSLLAFAREGAEIVDVGKRAGHCGPSQQEINQRLVERALRGQTVARLKGGDPFIFGRGAEEAEACVAAGVEWEVVPGVTSGIAATAYAGIPLLHRGHASSVAFLTGHPGRGFRAGLPNADTLVIFMCGGTIIEIARELLSRGRPGQMPVALISSGTCTNQEVRIGTLADLARLEEVSAPAPTLAVIGDVVALARKLHWFGGEPMALAESASRSLESCRATQPA